MADVKASQRKGKKAKGLSGAWVMVIAVEAPKAFLKLFLAILAGGVLLAAAILPFAGAGGWVVNASTDAMNSNAQDISENNTVPLRSRPTGMARRSPGYTTRIAPKCPRTRSPKR